jgi:hypothetical protein
VTGELQVVRGPRPSQHDPVEAIVVLELEEDLHAQPVAVEPDERLQVIGRTRDAQV